MNQSIAQSRNITQELVELKNRKDFSGAFACLEDYLEHGGKTPELLQEAGMLAKALRLKDKAVFYLGQVVQMHPDARTLGFEYAAALLENSELEKAEELARGWLKKNPKDFAFNNILAVILRRQNRQQEAVSYLKAARKADPKSIAPLINLGNIYLDLGDSKNAEEAYSQVVRQEPRNSEHARMLARTYLAQGNHQKALAGFRRSLVLNPSNVDALRDLANTFCNLGEYDEALKEVEQKISAFPDNAGILAVKGWVFMKMGKINEAAEVYESILNNETSNIDVLLAIAVMYEGFNREKANGYYQRAVIADNRSVKTLNMLAESLNRSRYGLEAPHIQEAYELCCEILEKSDGLKESNTLYGVLLRCVDYDNLNKLDVGRCFEYWLKNMNIGAFHLGLSRVKTMEDRFKLLHYHREWGRQIETQAAGRKLKRSAKPPREKIRVGYMSSDLRAHPVSYFALPLMEHYDKSRFEVYCYSFYTLAEDNLQKHIAGQVDKFNWWPKKNDQDVAQGILDDHLDILFELGGTTDMNKVYLMASKLAPIQASWLGYPHSAGLKDIDYILVDPFLQPDDAKLLLEKPFQVPETWVSLGRGGFFDVPINPIIPEERNGFLTFGTMNNPYKYTAEGIKTWSQIMSQVPNSKFLFVRPEGDVPGFRRNVEKEFAQHGITADRILYVAVRGKHLPHYNDIDIALDTFPHVGGTTTCETIWMGVPVITLVGPAFYERLSYSNLSNAGLPEFCAFTREEYVSKAVALAGDKEKRKFLRVNLRQQIKNHPLGQPQRFAENFYKTIEKVI